MHNSIRIHGTPATFEELSPEARALLRVMITPAEHVAPPTRAPGPGDLLEAAAYAESRAAQGASDHTQWAWIARALIAASERTESEHGPAGPAATHTAASE